MADEINQVRPPDRQLWFRWVLANAVGYALTIGLINVLYIVIEDSRIASTLSIFVWSAIYIAQGFALRPYLPDLRVWAWAIYGWLGFLLASVCLYLISGIFGNRSAAGLEL